MARLRDVGEFALIGRLLKALPGGARDAARPSATAGAGDESVIVGPGDDAAVLRPEPGRDLVMTTDAFIAGRHWLDAWNEPRALGVRLARANLSDLAAMAARPRWATLSLGLLGDREVEWVEALQAGVAAALAADGARLVGGNVVAVKSEESLNLTLIGDVLPGGAWTRHGARAGDVVVVTGRPGRAGAAVALIQSLGEGARAAAWTALLDAWRAPASRVELAQVLAASGAVHAAIDLSDGIAGDLAHLCAASGVGAVLDRATWPRDLLLEAAAQALGRDGFDLAAGASDDYELLLAVDSSGLERAAAIAHEAGVEWSALGRFTPSPGVLEWLDPAGGRVPLATKGFEHFG